MLQRLVAHLWADPDVAARVARARRASTPRGARRCSPRCAGRGLDASGASGLNVWLPVEDEAAAVAALLARGWAVAPGSRYELDGRGRAIRITTAALEPADAERLADDARRGARARAAAIRSG